MRLCVCLCARELTDHMEASRLCTRTCAINELLFGKQQTLFLTQPYPTPILTPDSFTRSRSCAYSCLQIHAPTQVVAVVSRPHFYSAGYSSYTHTYTHSSPCRYVRAIWCVETNVPRALLRPLSDASAACE